MNLLYLPHDNIEDIIDFVGNNFYLFSTVSKAYLSLYKNKFKNTKTKLYSNLNISTLKYAVKNKFILKKKKESFFSYDTNYYSSDGYKPGRVYNRYGTTVLIIRKDTICDIAARQENFECLEYGLRQGIKFNTYKNPNKKVRKFIIKCIEVYGKKIDYSVKRLVDGSYKAITAILNNNLSDFKSIIDEGYLINSNVAAQAAAVGKIEFLEYLRSNKCLIRDDALDYANIYCNMCNNPYKYVNTGCINFTCMEFDLQKAQESLIFVRKYLRDTKERYSKLSSSYTKMGFKCPC